MKVSRMKRCGLMLRYLILGCVATFLCGMLSPPSSALAQPPAVVVPDSENGPQTDPPREAAPTIALEDSGLSAGKTPEALLPEGAIVHLRINGSKSLLDDASKMAMPFVPEKAVGPMAEIALEEPNPLLAMIGMQTMGHPLSVETLSKMSGVDPNRPISLSFYLAPPKQGYALVVPVTDLTRFSALLSNAFPLTEPAGKVDLDGGFAYRLQTSDLEMFVVCSTDTVAICGSAGIAQAMLGGPDQKKLNQSTLVMNAIKKHQGANLLLAIDTAPVKPLLSMLDQYRTLPPQQIAKIRQEILKELEENEEFSDNINRQLQTRLGIRDVEQLLDYTECLASGGYEVLFENVFQLLHDLNGMTIAVDLSEEFQSVTLSLFSDNITAKNSTQPLPLEDVKKIIPELPGDKNFLVVAGKAVPPKKWVWLGSLIERVGKKMAEKKLPMELHTSIQNAYDAHTPVPTLGSSVDWTMGTRFFTTGKLPSDYKSLNEFFTAWRQQANLISVKAIPEADDDFLANLFAKKAKTTNANYADWRQLMQNIQASPSWLIQSSDSDSEKLDDGITKLTYEDRLKTRGGLFGYNEHELISRYFTLYRKLDGYTLLWPGGNDAETFKALKAGPLAPAFDRLMAHSNLPDNVSQIDYLRYVQTVVSVVDFVDSLETLVHREMNDYLTKIQKLVELKSDLGEDVVAAKMEAIDMPITVARVNWDAETKKAYLVTPVGWTFPRPKLAPVVVKLLADFRAASDSIGGAMSYQAIRDGSFDITVVQSTAGISKLVRSVGNNIAQQYLKNPGAQQELQKKLKTPLDRSAEQDPEILENSFWSFLP